jgi:hypothetical protein
LKSRFTLLKEEGLARLPVFHGTGKRMTGKMSEVSPRIITVAWGAMEVEGLGRGKDFMLWPGGGKEWNWQESGTQHSPGIQIADCREILANGSRIVVLSRGMLLQLKVPRSTIDFLEHNGIEVIVAQTKKAVNAYNALVAAGEAVGGLFHSTC